MTTFVTLRFTLLKFASRAVEAGSKAFNSQNSICNNKSRSSKFIQSKAANEDGPSSNILFTCKPKHLQHSINMNFKVANSLLLLALSSQETLAAVRGGGSHHDGTHGEHQTSNSHDGPGGHKQSGRPFSGGPNGDMPGFPGQEFEFNLTSISCDAAYDCEMHNGDPGVFVCRVMFHPITGEESSRAQCIPSDEAWGTDGCGCCGEDCPEQPDFIDNGCANTTQGVANTTQEVANTTQDVAFERHNRPGGADADVDVVCRTMTNPFTGDEMPMTLPIPADRGLDGDMCGCCDGGCPEPGEEIFERPDFVEKSCETEGLIACDIPHRRGEDGSEEQGFFVCREMFNARTGDSEQEALCISEDRAWETDDCGCCGEDCPINAAPVDIACTEEAEICELRHGQEEGIFVCRSVFHPIYGESQELSLCIPSDKAWVTDTCGCCDSGCPSEPEDGFNDEDAQLVNMTLEAYATAEESISGAASVIAQGSAILLFGVMTLLL
jgi:hypothetical protein